MKLLTILIALLPFLSAAQPADSWKVTHNGKVKLAARAEDPAANTVTLTRAELAKGNGFQIVFKPGAPAIGWIRTIALYTDADAELLSVTGYRFTLSNAALRAHFAGRTKLLVYTMSLPKDPAKRALVRVRRVHLCTIILKG
jgi:hypothetical protein